LLKILILYATASFACVEMASAQTSGPPGQWKKVIGSGFIDFSFADSLNGVGLGQVFSITIDGGKSWSNINSSIPLVYPIPCMNMVACTGAQKALVVASGCSKLALDGDSAIFQTCVGEGPAFDTWNTIAQKMYDSLYGFRFVQVKDRQGHVKDTARILVTHNGWSSYASFGDSLVGSELSTQGNGTATEIDGATIVDSNEVWVGINYVIYRTTDAGVTWDTIYPLNGTADSNVNPKWYDFIINRDSKEVYAKAYPPPLDYAYSTDYGKTWELDSAFKGHIARLAVPAPHTLWAVLCPSAFTNPNSSPPYSLSSQSTLFWCRSLAYSSNNGKSWSIDSSTFKVDSLIQQMHWFDARHGWISAIDYNPISDTNARSFIWYFNADGNAGVQTSFVGVKYGTIRVYPNPVTNTLNLEDSYPGLQIYDPLGQRYSFTLNGATIDVSGFSPGVYYLYDGITARAKFLKE